MSDAFLTKQDKPELELSVRIININYDDEKEVLNKSKTLKSYSYFISKVKQYLKSEPDLDTAIKKAIKECVKNNVLSEFLRLHGGEIMSLLTQEFDIDVAKKVWQEEAREEERNKLAFALIDVLDFRTISEKTGLSIEEIQKLQQQNQ